jgi:uncharacterized protein YidB (DUF937 family)
MGMFDNLEGKALNSVLGGSSNPLAQELLQLINNHPGGLAGLIQTFHQKGLGDQVNSWVGTGQNQPISPEQVHNALGSDTVQQLADKAGVSTETASSSLSQLLPMLVDKFTPNGQVPQQGNLMQTGMDMLKSWGKTGTEG